MNKIKFFTRSFDLKLYRLSNTLYQGAVYNDEIVPCVRLTDQSADGYFYTMLKDKECDIAINVDEDAFITDLDAVMNLVALMEKEGYANIGYSDGEAATTHRDKTVTNPFFNILNLKLLRTKFNKPQIVRNLSDAEPYYAFFRWMASQFKTLYLPCEKYKDGITTVAKDLSGNTICLHTWFSRFYSTPSFIVKRIEPSQGMQKKRIDEVIADAYSIRGIRTPIFGPNDKFLFLTDKIVRWIIKIPQRIVRWPYKLRKRIILHRMK